MGRASLGDGFCLEAKHHEKTHCLTPTDGLRSYSFFLHYGREGAS